MSTMGREKRNEGEKGKGSADGSILNPTLSRSLAFSARGNKLSFLQSTATTAKSLVVVVVVVGSIAFIKSI